MFSTVNLLFSAARQEKSYLVVCPQLFFMVSKMLLHIDIF